MKPHFHPIWTGITMSLLLLLGSCGSRQNEGETRNYENQDLVVTEAKEEAPDAMAIETPAAEDDFNEANIEHNTESYAYVSENDFKTTTDEPLSTFSIDVDNASYTNTRRFLSQNNSLPPVDAIRIEELINYFDYHYHIPTKEETFSINNELAVCPWKKDNYLLRIGIKGYTVPTENLPTSNLVFLVDVSGSMSDANKLPLLKKSLVLMVDKLDERDYVSLVVYAGNSGVVLEPTRATDKSTIIAALNHLESGGSTAGFEGLESAYQLAEEHFIPNGNNRIFLATDGDFNVGPSSDAEMARMVEKYRDKGIFITVLGFGMGNYKDSKMEIIADKGNGNYFYIDDISEAQKVLVDNLAATMYTIAKDVKIQVEFNPTHVASYRLIGYENRVLNNQDFEDDTKDAGELGAGHTVTAVYEIVPAQGKTGSSKLKYQDKQLSNAANSDELVTVKFRYKKTDENKSREIVRVVSNRVRNFDEASTDFRFTAAVAGWGMLLRQSKYAGNFSYDKVLEIATNALGDDEYGYRAEFLRLVKQSRTLSVISDANN